MIGGSRWSALAAVGVLLSAGSSAAAGETAATLGSPAGIAAESCAAMLDGLRRTEAATRDAVAAVREQRRRAEELRDWFGYETFGPYVSALREQERVLQGGLAEIGIMQCAPRNAKSQLSAD